MKTMTFKQLGRACNLLFRDNAFDEIAGMSKKHGGDMFQMGDEAHLKMQELM